MNLEPTSQGYWAIAPSGQRVWLDGDVPLPDGWRFSTHPAMGDSDGRPTGRLMLHDGESDFERGARIAREVLARRNPRGTAYDAMITRDAAAWQHGTAPAWQGSDGAPDAPDLGALPSKPQAMVGHALGLLRAPAPDSVGFATAEARRIAGELRAMAGMGLQEFTPTDPAGLQKNLLAAASYLDTVAGNLETRR
jgi:hypothetical protein